jgi:hypothetical protein
MRYNSDEDQRLTIRLPDDLREALTAEAQQQLRSLCSEIKFRLRQSLRTAGRGDGVTVDNNNSRQQKKAPARTGAKSKDLSDGRDTRPRLAAQ